MTTLLGIDEAGRGSVIGPMTIAGLLINKEDLDKLEALGVKDSKLLTPEKREELYPEIKKLAKDYIVLTISAKEIDELRKRINLNQIEAQKIAEIINAMKADNAFVDAPQVSTLKFKRLLQAQMTVNTKLTVENYADSTYKVCSAASVIAKVMRDKAVEELKKQVGYDFGVGYSHDARSIEFVNKCLKEGKNLDIIRHSWVTVIDLKKKKEQKTLGNY